MKVLQINCVYNEGSTGKITHAIHQGLIRCGIDSVVYYGRGKKASEAQTYKITTEVYAKAQNVISRLRGTMYGGCHLSTARLITLIKKENPDIVHLQCINGYFVNIYKLIHWLKKRKIKTVLTLHAEFMYTANCGHALDCEKWRSGCGSCPRRKQETLSWFRDGTADSFRQMRRAFSGFQDNLTVVSVSPWLRQRAEQSPILEGMNHRVVLNGLDTEIFRHQPSICGSEAEIKTVFHVTPMFSDDPDHLKGGYYVLELARRMKDMPVRFIVAGKHCLKDAVPDNVTLLGNVSDQKLLAKLYAQADLTVLTSKKETFSMVCAESLCCGTPVVGFEAGAPELITLPEYSSFVKQGDLDALEEAVRCWLRQDVNRQVITEAGKEQYSQEGMINHYINIYRSVLNEDKC